MKKPVMSLLLARFYFGGTIVQTKDWSSPSIAKVKQAAEQGDVAAQYSLGVWYVIGSGVAHDYSKAAVWFRKAAEQGDVKAQNNLGVMYHLGQGLEQDNKLAYVWCSVAAANGSPVGAANRGDYAKLLTPLELAEAQTLAVQYFEMYQPRS